MQLEAELANPFTPGQFGHLRPERNYLGVPLPLEQLDEVLGPGGDDPVRISTSIGIARASAHADNLPDAQHAGQPDGLSSDFGYQPLMLGFG